MLLSLLIWLFPGYHGRMVEILRNGDKEVAKVVTPSGVTGYIATCIPHQALAAFAGKLERKIAARRAARALIGQPASRTEPK